MRPERELTQEEFVGLRERLQALLDHAIEEFYESEGDHEVYDLDFALQDVTLSVAAGVAIGREGYSRGDFLEAAVDAYDEMGEEDESPPTSLDPSLN